jgi:hypothetical protein
MTTTLRRTPNLFMILWHRFRLWLVRLTVRLTWRR